MRCFSVGALSLWPPCINCFVAQVMTGHSLGRNKLEHLLASGADRGGAGADLSWLLLACHPLPACLMHFQALLLDLAHVHPAAGAMTRGEIEEAYAISRRIEAEERCGQGRRGGRCSGGCVCCQPQ